MAAGARRGGVCLGGRRPTKKRAGQVRGLGGGFIFRAGGAVPGPANSALPLDRLDAGTRVEGPSRPTPNCPLAHRPLPPGHHTR